MRLDNQQLLAILRLGHDILARGDGLSLHETFTRSGYATLIDGISRSKLVRLLREHPEILQQWISYSENKSATAGYRVSSGSFQVRRLESPDADIIIWGSVEEAVAEFILCELTYWSEVCQHNAASQVPPTVNQIAAALDQKRRGDLGRAQTRLFNDYGVETLLPSLIAAFPRIKSWLGRNVILFELIRFARQRPEVLQLALLGLKDAAFLVRMQSCIMLAYSQREDMIPHLEEILSHKDKKTRQHGQAAIDHIRNKTVFYDFHQT